MGLLLTGITYEEARGKWLARGTDWGSDRFHVGRYETEEEAAAALRAEMPVVKKRRVASKTSCIKGACVPPCVARRCTMRR